MLLAGGDPTELERDLAVPARLADGRRLDRVQRDVLEPARIEHEGRLLDLLGREDAVAGLEEEPAAQRPGAETESSAPAARAALSVGY